MNRSPSGVLKAVEALTAAPQAQAERAACFRCGHAAHDGECVNVAPEASRAAVPEGLYEQLKLIANMQEEDWPPQGAEAEELAKHWFAAYKRQSQIARAMLAAAPVAQEGKAVDGDSGASTQHPHLYVGNRLTGSDRGYVLPAAQQSPATKPCTMRMSEGSEVVRVTSASGQQESGQEGGA